jgi:3-dehydroquinate dehydratase-1
MVQTGSVTTTTTTSHLKEGAVIDVQEIPSGARPALLILHNEGEEDIVGIFADVLGQKWESATSVDDALAGPRETVYGLSNRLAKPQLDAWDRSRLLINTHRVDGGYELDESITDRCDYEYL